MQSLHLFQNARLETCHPSVMHYAKLSKSRQVISGGEDSCLLAIAAGFVDLILHQQLSQPARGKLLNQIVALYLDLFPGQIFLKKGLETPFERLNDIIQAYKANMSQFLTQLAFVFRQLAIDEIAANPENYRGLLRNGATARDLPLLKQPYKPLGESGVVALAGVLKMPIIVRQVELDKNLAKRLKYNEVQLNMLNPGIELMLDERQNQTDALIVNVNWFNALVGNAQIADVVLERAMQRPLPKLQAIEDAIDEQDKRMKRDYHDMLHRLNTALRKSEISRNELMNLYIANLAKNNDQQVVSKQYLESVFDEYFFQEL